MMLQFFCKVNNYLSISGRGFLHQYAHKLFSEVILRPPLLEVDDRRKQKFLVFVLDYCGSAFLDQIPQQRGRGKMSLHSFNDATFSLPNSDLQVEAIVCPRFNWIWLIHESLLRSLNMIDGWALQHLMLRFDLQPVPFWLNVSFDCVTRQRPPNYEWLELHDTAVLLWFSPFDL